MLALYRSGRQADALEVYRQARAVLVEQIGVEPGPELRELHAAVLRQDRSLDAPVQAALPPELERGPPLAGRTAELERLRAAWRGPPGPRLHSGPLRHRGDRPHPPRRGAGSRGAGRRRARALRRRRRRTGAGCVAPDAARARHRRRRSSGHGACVGDRDAARAPGCDQPRGPRGRRAARRRGDRARAARRRGRRSDRRAVCAGGGPAAARRAG